jgi:hypothetical protein
MLGATNEDLAKFFKVAVSTVSKWLDEIAEFSDAIKEGREAADAQVARRLYERATGYEHKAVKIVADAKTGAEHIVPYTEHYPPDTTAAIFWLKNRRPDLWRDEKKLTAEVNVKDERQQQVRGIVGELFEAPAESADAVRGSGEVLH